VVIKNISVERFGSCFETPACRDMSFRAEEFSLHLQNNGKKGNRLQKEDFSDSETVINPLPHYDY
jgi:hypothetical protein